MNEEYQIALVKRRFTELGLLIEIAEAHAELRDVYREEEEEIAAFLDAYDARVNEQQTLSFVGTADAEVIKGAIND